MGKKIIINVAVACMLLPVGLTGVQVSTASEEPSAFQKQEALFQQYCVKCHTIGQGDRVGPDLKDVHRRRDRAWLLKFVAKPSSYLESDTIAKGLLKKFAGVRMTDLGLSEIQVDDLLEFIETVSTGGGMGDDGDELLEETDNYKYVGGPDEGKAISAWGIASIFGLLVLSYAFWELGYRKVTQVMLVFAIIATYLTFYFNQNHHLIGNHQGYTPRQPIEFSHAQHAGDLEIACLYCHHGAEKSPVAGIPEIKICMNCHKVIKKARDATKPSKELEKLYAAWDTRDTEKPRSIRWVKVHQLQDYVSFNHQVHVKNNIKCQECHGPVRTMARMRQASTLSMGWCVNCHRNQSRKLSTHWKRFKGPVNCSSCHV